MTHIDRHSHSYTRVGGRMMSSLSAENLQLELSTCHSDGLSDKENVVQRMKYHVKQSPDSVVPVCNVTGVNMTMFGGREGVVSMGSPVSMGGPGSVGGAVSV